MLQVVLIDDERCVLEELAYLLQKHVSIIGKFTNSLEAVEAIAELHPDAVFLDIEMPGLNGLETAAEILTLLPKTIIIFVTAYSHHAVDAFELNAVDYLVKPVQPQRLQKSLQRIAKRLLTAEQSAVGITLEHGLQLSLTNQQPQTIALWRDDHLEIIPAEAIAACFIVKGNRGVSVIVHGCIYYFSSNLDSFVSKLESQRLLRCHRSYYINPIYLNRLDWQEHHTLHAYLMHYDEPIPVSRTYRQAVLDIFNQ